MITTVEKVYTEEHNLSCSAAYSWEKITVPKHWECEKNVRAKLEDKSEKNQRRYLNTKDWGI